MSTSNRKQATPQQQQRRTAHEQHTDTNTVDAELAVGCATCGAILPLDVSRDWIDRGEIECLTCRSVSPIEEVLLK